MKTLLPSLCVPAAALAACLFSSPCSGGVAAQSKPASASALINTFVIANKRRHVSVRDAQGHSLFTTRITTPNLILAFHFPNPQKSGLMTLKDAKNHALWSHTIPIDRKTEVRGEWSQEGINFVPNKLQAEAADETDDTKAYDGYAIIRPNNTLLKAHFGEGDEAIELKTTSNKAVIQSGDRSVSLQKRKDGSLIFNFDGKETPVTTVTKNGKKYSTFVWNGIRYNLAPGCQFHIDANGEVTIDAPAKGTR